MAHIIINPSLSAAITYNLIFNPPKLAEVSTILEPANSTRMDYSCNTKPTMHGHVFWKLIDKMKSNCIDSDLANDFKNH